VAAHAPPRRGTAGDRRAAADPLLFREGQGRGLDEASDDAVQRLVDACREDLRLATGSEPDEAVLRRPLAGAALAARLALGVFDRAGDLVAAVDVYRDLPRAGSWLVGYVLVRPDVRGRGLATGLLARVQRLATAAGAARLDAVVPARNPAILQCLRRAGFAPDREVEIPVGDRTVRGFHLVRELGAGDAPHAPA
jgi:GNAT superfamily N-acetyltransferase